jgi:hypothetical protein
VLKGQGVTRPRYPAKLLNRDYGLYLVGRLGIDLEETERGAVSKNHKRLGQRETTTKGGVSSKG